MKALPFFMLLVISAMLFTTGCAGNEANSALDDVKEDTLTAVFDTTQLMLATDTVRADTMVSSFPILNTADSSALLLKKRLAADSTGKLPEETKKEMKKAKDYIKSKLEKK